MEKYKIQRFRFIFSLLLMPFICVMAYAREPDPWLLTVENPDADNYYGISVANGQMGILSSPEPLKTGKLVLGGVYDVSGRARINQFMPALKMLDIDMRIDGRAVNRRSVKDFTQTLDMRHACFKGSFTMTGRANVEYSYMALRNLPYNCMMTITVTPLEDVMLEVSNILTAGPIWKDPEENFTSVKDGDRTYYIAYTTAKSPVKGIVMGASSVMLPDTSYALPLISHKLGDYGVHSQAFSISLKKHRPYTLHVVGTLMSDVNTKNIVSNEVMRQAFYVAVEGAERLRKKHLDEWDELWKSDIIIDGDAQSQQDIHSMLYHLYSFVRAGSGLSTSPMGLSGDGYSGHVFWDTETWIYPPLLLLHSELAHEMLEYRFNHLDGARQKAYTHGYKGAMFPWESAASGNEEIQYGNLYGHYEVHIGADIALAAWQYYLVTRDTEWLRTRGYPLLEATADFYVSRVERDDKGSYILKNVIGADERNKNLHGGKTVDNNAYTIGAVKANLHNAVLAARKLGFAPHPGWSEVEQKLSFERFDNGLIREHSTYNGEDTKQADVVLLAYPLNFLKSKEDVSRNLEYYLRTVPRKKTPAMSKAIYSILYSQTGDRDKAWQYFEESYLPNLNPPFRVIAEFDGGTNPYFITGAGGTLQAVMMGFCGLRIDEKGISQLTPQLPKHWKSVTLTGIGPQHKTIKINQ